MQLSILQAVARARGRLYGIGRETVKSVRLSYFTDLGSPTASESFEAIQKTRRLVADIKGRIGDQDTQPSLEHVWT